MAGLTYALVGTSLATVVLLFFQYWAYKTAESAHVIVSSVEGKVTKNARVFIWIENSGRVTSPRVSGVIRVVRIPVGSGTPDYLESQTFGGGKTQIPPGPNKFGLSLPIAQGTLAETEIKNIEQGKKTLVIIGRIDYDPGLGWPFTSIESSPVCFRYDHASLHNKWSLCTGDLSSTLTLKTAPPPIGKR